jgi:hypothetical protein
MTADELLKRSRIELENVRTMMGRNAWIDCARAKRIEAVLAARGHHLRRCGGELIGPCPICGGCDRFAVNPKKALWNCRGCGKGGDVIALVRHLGGCSFTDAVELLTGEEGGVTDRAAVPPDPVRRAQAKAETTEHERRQHEKAARLWSQRRPIKGTIAEKYLHGRGISCPLAPTLAFLPPLKPEHRPAMVAAFALPDEIEPGLLGEPRNVDAVHLTLLKPDGSGKAEITTPKLIVGSPRSMPIVLAPPNDLLGLAIVEGIETGLSIYVSTGLGVWVAGSAGRIPALADEIPDCIECVTIYQEADRAGELQAAKLARLLFPRGVEVFVAEASP